MSSFTLSEGTRLEHIDLGKLLGCSHVNWNFLFQNTHSVPELFSAYLVIRFGSEIMLGYRHSI